MGTLTYREKPNGSQPSTDLLFQSVTRRSVAEQCDMENLEILGDCFLKLAVSLCFYYRYPEAMAGSLTDLKKTQISNNNLTRISMEKKLRIYLNASKIEFRGKRANWLPPGFVSDPNLKEDFYSTQQINIKAFADMIEAMIGAYLISTDYISTLIFMASIGLDVIPYNENSKNEHFIDS